MAKKRVTKKRKAVKGFGKKELDKKTRKSFISLVYSLIAFILSFVFYNFVTIDGSVLQGFFGLISIITLSLVILFAVIELILYVIRYRKNNLF